jgi:hypothetical protein
MLIIIAAATNTGLWNIVIPIVLAVISVATASVGIISRAQIKAAKAATDLVLVRADEMERQLHLAQQTIVELQAQVKALQDATVEYLGTKIAEKVISHLDAHLGGKNAK